MITVQSNRFLYGLKHNALCPLAVESFTVQIIVCVHIYIILLHPCPLPIVFPILSVLLSMFLSVLPCIPHGFSVVLSHDYLFHLFLVSSFSFAHQIIILCSYLSI